MFDKSWKFLQLIGEQRVGDSWWQVWCLRWQREAVGTEDSSLWWSTGTNNFLDRSFLEHIGILPSPVTPNTLLIWSDVINQAGYRHIALRTEGNFPMSLPMLFCNIDLKVVFSYHQNYVHLILSSLSHHHLDQIYIPDGLGGFMLNTSADRIASHHHHHLHHHHHHPQ